MHPGWVGLALGIGSPPALVRTGSVLGLWMELLLRGEEWGMETGIWAWGSSEGRAPGLRVLPALVPTREHTLGQTTTGYPLPLAQECLPLEHTVSRDCCHSPTRGCGLLAGVGKVAGHPHLSDLLKGDTGSQG